MRILATSETHKPITLGDDDQRQFISELLPVEDGIVQIAPANRADRVEVFDRGNLQVGFQWVVCYGHESKSAAFEFNMKHLRDIPRLALITMTHWSAGQMTELYIPNAWLRPCRCVYHYGKATHWSYTLTAAGIFDTKS